MSQAENENESAGIDSFLDVISNFVGILIILVMVVGERAKNFPYGYVPPASTAEVESAHAEEAKLAQDVHGIAAQMDTVRSELEVRTRERGQIQTIVTAIERDLADRRAALDEKSRGRFDIERDLALARDEIGRLEKERQQVEKVSVPETIKIESYPTPLSKTVDGKEAHFQLSGGRIVYVPFEILVEQLKGVVREQAWKMQDQPEITDTLGPVGGFRLRYTIERHDTPRGSFIQPSFIEFLPSSSQLGETVDVALAPKSKFRDKLEMLSPRHYTITIWTYPDSFAEFRRLKKELYGLGYGVAARPLFDGMPISGSPQGTRSSAE